MKSASKMLKLHYMEELLTNTYRKVYHTKFKLWSRNVTA